MLLYNAISSQLLHPKNSTFLFNFVKERLFISILENSRKFLFQNDWILMRYKSDDPKIHDRKSSDLTSLACPHSIDSEFWVHPNESFFALSGYSLDWNVVGYFLKYFL